MTFRQVSAKVLAAEEGLPGAALSDDSSSADDFVMIANDMLHSAAQSCSKDVVSIGTGNLEDGLCAGDSEGQTGLPKLDWRV